MVDRIAIAEAPSEDGRSRGAPRDRAPGTILRVAVPVPLADTFDYAWTGEAPAPRPGCRVRVPFGRSRRIGVVIDAAEKSEVPRERLKAVLEVLDEEPIVGAELLETLRWAADYYHHPIGEVVRHAVPGLLRKGRAVVRPAERPWRLTAAGAAAAAAPRGRAAARATRQTQALDALLSRPATDAELRDLGVYRDAVSRLAAKGWIERADPELAQGQLEPRPGEPLDALPGPQLEPLPGRQLEPLRGEQLESPPARQLVPPGAQAEGAAPPELTADQRRVLEQIAARPPGFTSFLLYGVTGSGKTEIFLRLIAAELLAGRQTLLLVPEIALTPQLVARLRERFGQRLAVVHSSLTDTERLAAWRRSRSGEAGVVVGTRSAVFAALARPGLVIVDEEHDASYKQQQGFHYSARDVAVVRARRLGIPVLLASATPSLESFHNARTGRYRLLEMPNRIGTAGQPRIVLVDLGRHASRGALSTPLVAAIERHLGAGNQILLFLNRRGFAPALFCATCREVEQCRRCDARLTVHAAAAELRCHHCGDVQTLRFGCPRCGAERIAVGAGTERVTQELHALFPGEAIGRLDRDATSRKGALDSVLDDVRRGATRILVGTQMLVKGHDFPNVTLVGVLNADQGLFGTELRADERLAQTIVQVAGRAGRRETPGEVMIQTHYPGHPLLARLLDEGYAAFADLALEERRRALWPPHSHLALWRAEATQRPAVFAFLERLAAECSAGFGASAPPTRTTSSGVVGTSPVESLGPAPEPMERRAGRFRGRLLLRSCERRPLHALLDHLLAQCRRWPETRRVRWSVDVDAQDA